MDLKKNLKKTLFLAFLSACVSLNPVLSQNYSGGSSKSSIWDKDEITIVVTDSGLGGLSVLNDIAVKMKDAAIFKRVNLIFANALFDDNSGYNSLQNRQEKITRLNSVLEGMDDRFHPDMIFIACNTLSVIYNDSEFVKTSGTHIYGIVEPGVRLIHEKLQKELNSRVIIFGTETTIAEGSHKKALLELGLADYRIIEKECPQLQAYIEQNPFGEETELLISLYLEESIGEIDTCYGTTFISLNCSHYGYSEELWRKAADKVQIKYWEILNPNSVMGDILISEKQMNRFARTELTFNVVSKVEILNNIVISDIFLENSPELAAALRNYTIDPNLFK